MANLIYSMITSLDGYVEDANGNFGWGVPDEEVHTFINDLSRPVGTYMYGRRMYETMVYWETAHTVPGQPQVILDWLATGRQRRRLSTRGPWSPFPARRRASSAASNRRLSAASRPMPVAT